MKTYAFKVISKVSVLYSTLCSHLATSTSHLHVHKVRFLQMHCLWQRFSLFFENSFVSIMLPFSSLKWISLHSTFILVLTIPTLSSLGKHTRLHLERSLPWKSPHRALPYARRSGKWQLRKWREQSQTRGQKW